MNHDIYNEVEIFEVYEFYDMPLCYTAKNEHGDLLLVYFCDVEEGWDGWLICVISEEVLQKLRNKEIDYNSAYGNVCCFSKEDWKTGAVISELLTRHEAEERNYLPPAGLFVEWIEGQNKG